MPRRILAVFAHPDDESFASGGTLAFLASRGAEIRLVTATRGERGAGPDPGAIGRTDLAALRERELRTACIILGIAPPVFLGLPDGSVRDAGGDALAERILAAAADFDPDLVVTFGPDGAYGHPDHVAIGQGASRAFERGLGRRLLHVAYPRGLFLPQYDLMLSTPLAPVVRLVERGGIGVDLPGAGVLKLDISRFSATKGRAIAAHWSQLRSGDPHTLFPPGIVAATLQTEWFLVAGGPAVPAGASDPCDGL